MRIPVPTNKLVAFTLLGAVLTAGVAGGLVLSDGQPVPPDPSPPAQQAAQDAPAPNPNFTPAVQRSAGYEDEEREAHEEREEHENEAESDDEDEDKGHDEEDHDVDETEDHDEAERDDAAEDDEDKDGDAGW